MKILLLFTFVIFQMTSSAQLCTISVTPAGPVTLCPGDSVLVTAIGNLLSAGQAFDFNTGVIPSGWSSVGSASFATPCGPSIDGTPYYWASTAGGTPGITTSAIDVTCGGAITFDMVYSIQGGTSPCEGPDLMNEGVSLQYSLNGGLTWIDIIYYAPDGFSYPANTFGGSGALPPGNLTNYTSWSSFFVPLPAGALGPGTMFQWVQLNSSGSCCDNWGIDNIIINATGLPCGSNVVLNWDNGIMDTNSFYMVPTGDTSVVAMVFDTTGVLQCVSDTVFFSLYNGFAYTLVDTVAVNCPSDSIQVQVLNLFGESLPVTYNWSTGDTTSSTYLPANGFEPDTITFYVDITDSCGFMASDSVVLVVSQDLIVDSLTSIDQVNCDPNGQAQVFVSGNVGALNYSWTGPGSGGPVVSTGSNVIGGTGWYYVDVNDAVCSLSDSIFVDSVRIDMLTYDLIDTAYLYCPNDSIQVDVLNIVGADLPIQFNWSTGSNASSTYIYSSNSEQETIIYYVDFIDDCGFTRSDSVVLIVDQLLQVSSVTQIPTTTCQPDGSVLGAVTGVTGTANYQWNDQLNFNNPGSGSFVNTAGWQNIGAGWYYFTVSDNVCSVLDSVEVIELAPPISSIIASPVYGCVGTTVTLVNNSLNTTYYYWDFDNGNNTYIGNSSAQSQTYYSSGNVMLISYLDSSQTCSDTSYVPIDIVVCGCTDPRALNYIIDAVVDDGGCVYPIPVVLEPNIFTPNNDGENDVLFLETTHTVILDLLVTNRWGNVVYDQSIPIVVPGQQVGWDGRSPNGTKANEGTYFYQYTATGINGDLVSGQGFVQLVRD